VLVTLALAGGYSFAVAVAPLPELRATMSVEPEIDIAAETEGANLAVTKQRWPSAIGWSEGDDVWSNDDQAYPIASLTKLVTVLVCLDESPVAPGEDGPVHTWTVEDQQRQYQYLAQQGVAYPIPVGTKVTTRQMLELSLLPSANDFASAYAYSVFGDNASFVKAVSAWKNEHGLDSLTIAEPSGLDERDVANAEDLVRISRMALENETMREIMQQKTAELPWGIGTVHSTNPLFGRMKGIVGLKTGSLSVVGFNLAAAQSITVGERSVTGIAVSLARPTKGDRIASGESLLGAMAKLPHEVTLVEAGEPIGSVTTWQGEHIALFAEHEATAILLPGETAHRSIALDPVAAGAAGQQLGAISTTAPTPVDEVPIITDAAIVEPDFWWRFTHPAELFTRSAE